jgi:hypothetical protein
MITNDWVQQLEAQRILIEKAKLEPGDYYYDEDKKMVFTEQYLLKKQICCNNGCKNCPYPELGEGDEYRQRNFDNHED